MIAQIDLAYVKLSFWATIRRLLSYVCFEGRPLTTKGRWINPLIFLSFNFFSKLPQFKKVKNPLFILGTGRSGTTVLGIVFSMHKDIGFLNEPKALWHSIYKNEDLIGSYSCEKARYRLFESDANSLTIKRANRLFGLYSAVSFSERVLDKYPELIFRVPFVKSLFEDAQFLFLVRNGWDTCHSIDSWSKRLGTANSNEIHDWWGVNRRKWNLLLEQVVCKHDDLVIHIDAMRNWTRQVDMAAVEWIVTMREGMRLLKLYPNIVFRVTYEELCANPKLVLTDICKFANLALNDHRFYYYAEHTLKPTTDRKYFELNNLIKNQFIQTMNELGYCYK